MKKVTDLKENECIHCATKEEFRNITKLNPNNVLCIDEWEVYKENTVYYPTRTECGCFGSVNHAKEYNYTIHPASDFLQPTYQLTKSQIIKISENPSLVKELFPDVFEVELKIGRWYKSKSERGCTFAYFQGFDVKTYGIAHFGDWVQEAVWFNKKGNIVYDNFGDKLEFLELATPEEVETALVNEAKMRYINETVIALNLHMMANNPKSVKLDFSKNYHLDNYNRLWINASQYNAIVFYNGTWAEILKTPNDVIKVIETYGTDKLLTFIEAYNGKN